MTPQQHLEACAAGRVAGRHDVKGAMLEIAPGSDTLVISCSGIVPPATVIYAMENSTRSIPINKLFICDKHSRWYYGGIEGLSSSFDETVDVVAAIVRHFKPSRIYAAGTSGGGYMAMALTGMLGLDRCLAMAPQTTLLAADRQAIGDARWPQNMDDINRRATPYDISALVPRAPHASFNIIYPAGVRVDAIHAQRVTGPSQVTTFALDTSDHNVSGHMRTIGILQPCLDAFLSAADSELGSRLASVLDGHLAGSGTETA